MADSVKTTLKLPAAPKISEILGESPVRAIMIDCREMLQQVRLEITGIAEALRVPEEPGANSEVSPEVSGPEATLESASTPKPFKRPLSDAQCMSCLAHNHYLAARGRIKEVIKFYEREGGFTETVIAKMHDTMEDLIVPNRDDYAATSKSPLVRKMLHEMQNRGDAIKKELEEIVLNPESHTLPDLEKVKNEIVDIQKAAWRLTALDREVRRSESSSTPVEADKPAAVEGQK